MTEIFKNMINKMPCGKKTRKTLMESWRSTKKRIDDALIRSKLFPVVLHIAIVLAILSQAASIVYFFWPSSPDSHTSGSSENSDDLSSESLAQNKKHNYVEIDSDQLDPEPVNACDKMVDAAPKAFIVDENSVTGCRDGILSAKRNGKNVEVYNMVEVRDPGDTNNSSQEGITLSYCDGWCSLETLVKAADGTLVKNPSGDEELIKLGTGTYRFKVVYNDDAISKSVLVRSGKRM